MVPLLLALPFGPFLAWKRGDILGAAQRLMFAAMLAVVVSRSRWLRSSRAQFWRHSGWRSACS